MERFVMALVLFPLGLTAPAVAQMTSAPSTNNEARQDTISLSQDQKQAVMNAAVRAKSRQKTPEEFSPGIGATVPKEVYLHGFEPEVTKDNPLLKGYLYAFLDREVVLVDGLEKKVVAVLPLPEKLVAGEQPHQGAAEASSRETKDGATPAASVPSHTSPETIK